MPTFSSKPFQPGRSRAGTSAAFWARLVPQVRRRPFLFFGVPFLTTMVGASFALSTLTQTRYDYNATKVQSLSKEEELGMRKDRRRIDVREEYFRLQSEESTLDDWEPKRIDRPEGVPEWGVPPPPSRRSIHNDSPKGGLKAREDHDEGDAALHKSLPRSNGPGIVLGPDGKPCRACNSKLAFSAAMKASKGNDNQPKSKSVLASAPAAPASSLAETSVSHNQCPPDGEALGAATWTFLHSAAAYYPSTPSAAQQDGMLSLLRGLAHVYPCASCAESLREEYSRERREGHGWTHDPSGTSKSAASLPPPLEKAVRSGPALRKWLCGLHNEVNARLGKPLWDCENQDTLQARWRDGPSDGSCD